MTDNSNAGTMTDIVRAIGGALNRGVYFLLSLMYQIFFNVASVQLFENETIKNFYGRVQLIIGVFMIFKLTISILQGIMDPDKFTNPKDGFGSIITRVIVALVMLTLIVPINIPNVENANSLEKYINNNGILFGALYSLQDRILTNNTLGRLILGTNDGTGDESTDQFETQNEKLVSSANVFATTILKAFFRINMLPEESRDSNDESLQSNWYCGNNLSDDNKKAIEAYTNLNTSTDTLLSDEMIYGDCEINDDILSTLANAASHIPVVGTFFENFGGESRYLFVFHWFPAIIVGIVFLVILVGFTVDIAIRSIKLSILRLLAPIPIISYIEPKSSKDGGMFSSWVSALTSTYLDLFLRLAIVYFVIFLVQDMIANGIIINEANGVIGFISCIFIWLGLFFFAKMAPKFIKDVLGLKGTMSNVGLSGILAGMGAIRQGGTLPETIEAMNDATRAQTMAYAQGKSGPELGDSWNSGRDHIAKIITGDQNMSGRRMSRGARHLKRMGIDTPMASEMKTRMYDAQDKANSASDLYNRFVDGEHYDESELQAALGNNYNAADSYDAKRKKLYDYKESTTKAAAMAKTDYEDIKGMQKQYGQARSYEAKYEGSNDGRYFARARNSVNNRAVASFGVSSDHRGVQRWRTQNYPSGSGTAATTPQGSGIDLNPTGGMGEGSIDGDGINS